MPDKVQVSTVANDNVVNLTMHAGSMAGLNCRRNESENGAVSAMMSGSSDGVYCSDQPVRSRSFFAPSATRRAMCSLSHRRENIGSLFSSSTTA